MSVAMENQWKPFFKEVSPTIFQQTYYRRERVAIIIDVIWSFKKAEYIRRTDDAESRNLIIPIPRKESPNHHANSLLEINSQQMASKQEEGAAGRLDHLVMPDPAFCFLRIENRRWEAIYVYGLEILVDDFIYKRPPTVTFLLNNFSLFRFHLKTSLPDTIRRRDYR